MWIYEYLSLLIEGDKKIENLIFVKYIDQGLRLMELVVKSFFKNKGKHWEIKA